MDLTEVTNIISNVGFPIFACFFMSTFAQKIWKESNDTIMHMVNEHKNETDALLKSFDKNTQAISILSERIGGLENEVNKG